jgi:NUMOD3 motif
MILCVEGVGVIYALCDPQSGEVRYVGQTRDMVARLCKHMRDVRYSPPGSRHVLDWIRSLAPVEPDVVILETDPPGGLNEAEKAWIATLRLYGCRLTNLTDGGSFGPIYGQTPWNKGKVGVLSGATRQKMSESAKRRTDRPRHTEESKRKLSEARKGQDWIREAGRKGGFAKAARTREVMPSA